VTRRSLCRVLYGQIHGARGRFPPGTVGRFSPGSAGRACSPQPPPLLRFNKRRRFYQFTAQVYEDGLKFPPPDGLHHSSLPTRTPCNGKAKTTQPLMLWPGASVTLPRNGPQPNADVPLNTEGWYEPPFGPTRSASDMTFHPRCSGRVEACTGLSGTSP
jgi:hypothetical protein